jgi:hypothetical protein
MIPPKARLPFPPARPLPSPAPPPLLPPRGFSFVLGYCFFYFHYRSEMSGFLQSTFFFACAMQPRGDATARRCNRAAVQPRGGAARGRARACLGLLACARA